MNIRSLNHFLALAEHLHFGQASVASNISISALSRTIRQLEQETGVLLFNRDNRTVRLTAKGRMFHRYAKDATRQWREICSELTDSGDELRGELSLYCSVTASHSLLFDLLNRFRPDYPGVEIKLHTGDPEHAISRVVAGEEEIAVAAQPRSVPRGVEFKTLIVSPLLFIVPVESGELDLPLPGGNGRIRWAQVPMILSEGGIARARVNEWFRHLGVTPRIYAQVAGNEAIVSMVSLGLGVGVVPEIVLDNSPLAGSVRILDVKPGLAPYNVGLCTLKRNQVNPIVSAFWNLV
ncbi:transcriptional regulator IlvY [Chromatiales bacterium (ex Bugula neritina AB1)]|nr:transcriptional regulator IlvY [Chromatiales bacterium (ex Bugula neritina AB1)]